jgi:orotate phosphoribosyltransferase-like protein
VNDNAKQDAPGTKQMDENVVKIRELVWSDRRLTSRMIADELDMSKEIVRKILVQDLGMRN